MLPLVWLPKIWPRAATVVHKNGNRALRRSSAFARQNSWRRSCSLSQMPPFFSFIKVGSAPAGGARRAETGGGQEEAPPRRSERQSEATSFSSYATFASCLSQLAAG